MNELKKNFSGTEDDTFNVLSRTPIKDLDTEYRQRMWEFYSSPEKFEQWLSLHKWNEKEFFEAGKKYELQLRKFHRG